MYSSPSTAQIRAPSARAIKNGSPPTLRNARTGEFTPPGIRFCARAKNSEECDVTCRGACAKRLCIYARRLIQAPRQRYCPLSQKRRGSQVVRSRSAKPLFAGSIPAPACLIASAHLPERQERQAEFCRKKISHSDVNAQRQRITLTVIGATKPMSRVRKLLSRRRNRLRLVADTVVIAPL